MFVSYAQNFEDVLLWRALKDVTNGFYIDVGAYHPVDDSVSLAFYERGWRGVHVEPLPASAAALRAARPDEDVVEAAISTEEGVITFYDVPDTGLGTGMLEFAEEYRADDLQVRTLEAKTLRLSSLLDQYRDRDIHWLKIDVEGMEAAVIESWPPSDARPWVVVIESTRPRSQAMNFSEWEPTLLTLGYIFAYFDGLNRFYVHEAHAHLVGILSIGANFFDDFAVGGNSPFARALNVEIRHLNHLLDEAREEAAAGKAASAQEIDAWWSASPAHAVELELGNEAIASPEATIVEQRSHLAGHDDRMAGVKSHATPQPNPEGLPATPRRTPAETAFTVWGWPKAKVRLLLEHAFLWIRRRPRIMILARRCLRFVPPLERRLLAFARVRIACPILPEERWALDPDPQVHEEWRRLLAAASGGR